MFHLNDVDVIEDNDVDDGLSFMRVATPFERVEAERAQRRPPPLALTECRACERERRVHTDGLSCEACHGIGFLSVPTSREAFRQTRPGSNERVAILAARYRQGLELFAT